MATQLLFRDDAYLAEAGARVIAVSETGAIRLDRTVFYAAGGGQPGDSGHVRLEDGTHIAIVSAGWGDAAKTLVDHMPAPGASVPPVGASVVAVLDWAPRLLRMRTHTALHLLSVALPYPVTGGAIGDGEGRLDFDIPDAAPDRDAIEERLRAMVAADAAVTDRWITDEELDANPTLVKTLSVKPPRGSGRIRLVEIDGLDLQPCGGTHVRRTSEIGAVSVTQIEKKGRQNRRVRIALA